MEDPNDTLEASLQKTLEHVRGAATPAELGTYHFVPPEIDVGKVRAAVGLTQAQFAARYGLSLGAVRKWEAGTRVPDAAARVLFFLLMKSSATVDELLGLAPAPQPQRKRGVLAS